MTAPGSHAEDATSRGSGNASDLRLRWDYISTHAEHAEYPGLVYTEGVGGSSPSSPTNPWHSLPADPSKITMEGRTGRTVRASFRGLPGSFREISRLDRSNATGELLDTPGAPS